MSLAAQNKLDDADFECLRKLVYEQTGISMDNSKRQLIASRIGRRLRPLNLSSFSEYCELVSAPGAPELETFINAVTTNLTYFFREPSHFEHLTTVMVPKWQRANDRTPLRIWSAGCSSGEEPYSVAISLADSLGDAREWQILATDIDSSVLDLARAGIYPTERASRVPGQTLARWFQKGVGRNAGKIRVREQLRRRITFNRLNLMQDWPMRRSFDAVFCRNVVIYFNKSTQATLFDRLADRLVSGGVLYVGHSETLFKVSDRFRLIGQTTYEKVA